MRSAIFLIGALVLQDPQGSLSPFTEREKTLYLQKRGFNDRMELFQDVLGRYRKDFERANRGRDVSAMAESLSRYERLLKSIENDVLNLPAEKKSASRPLRKVEIELRQTSKALEDIRGDSGSEERDSLESAIVLTESVRIFILQTIFGKDLLKAK